VLVATECLYTLLVFKVCNLFRLKMPHGRVSYLHLPKEERYNALAASFGGNSLGQLPHCLRPVSFRQPDVVVKGAFFHLAGSLSSK